MIRGIRDGRNSFCAQNAKRAAGREYRCPGGLEMGDKALGCRKWKRGEGVGEKGGGGERGHSLVAAGESVTREGDRPTAHSGAFHLKIQKECAHPAEGR